MVTAAKMFDDVVIKTALSKLNINRQSALTEQMWDNALTQLQLPVKMGGHGLHKMADLSPIAYYASLAAAVENNSLMKITQHSVSSHAGDAMGNANVLSSIQYCLTHISSFNHYDPNIPNSNTLHGVLPPNNNSLLFQSHFTPDSTQTQRTKSVSLQMKISHVFHTSNLNKFTECVTSLSSKSEDVRIKCIAAPHAADWKRATPCHSSTIFSNIQYQVATRFNLGLKPFDNMPRECHSCRRRNNAAHHTLLQDDSWHYLNCTARRNAELGMRHDNIKKSIDVMVSMAGGLSIQEPANLNSENQQRPDLIVALDNKTILVDTTVINPIAPTYVNQSFTKQTLGAAHHKAQEKKKKYAQMLQSVSQANEHKDSSSDHNDNNNDNSSINDNANDNNNTFRTCVYNSNSSFVPFAVETYGGFCEESQQFLQELAAFSTTHQSVWTAKEISSSLRFSIAVAIQRGNAMACLSGFRFDTIQNYRLPSFSSSSSSTSPSISHPVSIPFMSDSVHNINRSDSSNLPHWVGAV
jgi:hypothetical protein